MDPMLNFDESDIKRQYEAGISIRLIGERRGKHFLVDKVQSVKL
jgi:hypothetical protein